MKSLFYFLIFFLLSLKQIEASVIEFKGRILAINCETSESQSTDFVVNYNNSKIVYGAKVYLIYGSANSVLPNRWIDNKQVEMKRVEPFTYSSLNSMLIASPELALKIANINFIIKIVMPNGEIHLDKGSDSKLGFYQVTLNGQKTCVSSDNEYPDFLNWNIKKIIKN